VPLSWLLLVSAGWFQEQRWCSAGPDQDARLSKHAIAAQSKTRSLAILDSAHLPWRQEFDDKGTLVTTENNKGRAWLFRSLR